MGRERTKLKPVIAVSSMFMMSSFFLLSSNISSRVMSRVSMNERSSTGSFLPKIPSSMDRVAGEAALVTKASAVGANTAIPTSKVRAIVKREKDIIVVVLDVVVSIRMGL